MQFETGTLEFNSNAAGSCHSRASMSTLLGPPMSDVLSLFVMHQRRTVERAWKTSRPASRGGGQLCIKETPFKIVLGSPCSPPRPTPPSYMPPTIQLGAGAACHLWARAAFNDGVSPNELTSSYAGWLRVHMAYASRLAAHGANVSVRTCLVTAQPCTGHIAG